MSKWQEFLSYVSHEENESDPDFHIFHSNPQLTPYIKGDFQKGLKRNFGSIRFSTGKEIVKKLPKYLPGTILCLGLGLGMMRVKWTSNAAAGIAGCIPIVLIVIGVITLTSLFLNITIFDKEKPTE